jgi:Ca-activated chloride channel family protein
VARVRLNASGPAAGVQVARVDLRYADARSGAPGVVSTTVVGTVTEDVRLADAHADSNATAAVNRALGARKMAEAADAFREGRRDSGLALLDNVRSLFGASAEALSGDIQELDKTRAELEKAESPDAYQDHAKRLNKKAFRGFGQSNSY